MQYFGKTLNPRIALPFALVMAIVAFGTWYYLLRPVPQLQQLGTIQNIAYLTEEHVEKNVVRSPRNQSGTKSSSYKIPNRFIYTIKLADGLLVRYQETAINAKSTPEYQVGEKLNIIYTIRALPFGEPSTLVYELEKNNSNKSKK